MENAQNQNSGVSSSAGKRIPYLAEMVDTYSTLFYDYLKTDSISTSEDLLRRLEQVEGDMKKQGCEVQYSTDKWLEFLCTVPDIKKYDQIAPTMFKEAQNRLQGTQGLAVLQCLRTIEETTLNKLGRKATENAFYSGTDIIEVLNGYQVRKNVMFSDLAVVEQVVKNK